MIGRLLILAIIAFVVFVVLRGVLAKRKLTVKQFFAIYFATLLGIALLFLAISGRLHPLFAVLGAVLPFAFRTIGLLTQGVQLASVLRGLRGAMGMGGHQPPDQSEISTDYIHMVLNHDSGTMDGEVLAGQFKNMKLSNMTVEQLTALLQEVTADNDSVNLLVAYLDREHPDWQQGHSQYGQGDSTTGRRPPPSDGPMNEREALEILGLEPGASREDIIAAHKRLMQKLHPDRGGSTYLATKINAAKDHLLEGHG